MNGYKIEKYDCISSTNDYIKTKREERENLIVVAREQTKGRGTKGRSFSSSQGGVYLSKLTFYKDFSAKNAFLIMAGAAVAVCKTLQTFGLQPKIKWANDVFVDNKKICGILIENVFSGNRVDSSIVGVGLNVCNALPVELNDIATTMQESAQKTFAVEEVEKTLIAFLSQEHTMQEYRSFLTFLGEEKTLIVGEEEKKATLLSVDDDGALWVGIEGKKEKFYSAEVSLRV